MGEIAGKRAGTTPAPRDYAPLIARAPAGGDRSVRMQRVCDLMWDAFSTHGVSWIGFYEKVSDADEMVLLARRDKPACSPLGLHGMCGRCWTARRPMVVRDVATLGGGYIACDPNDKSEVVLPLFEAGGACWGVIDADSHDVGTFDERDARELRRLVERAGLSDSRFGSDDVIVL